MAEIVKMDRGTDRLSPIQKWNPADLPSWKHKKHKLSRSSWRGDYIHLKNINLQVSLKFWAYFYSNVSRSVITEKILLLIQKINSSLFSWSFRRLISVTLTLNPVKKTSINIPNTQLIKKIQLKYLCCLNTLQHLNHTITISS